MFASVPEGVPVCDKETEWCDPYGDQHCAGGHQALVLAPVQQP